MSDLNQISKDIGEMKHSLLTLVEHKHDHEERLRSLEVIALQAQGGWKIVLILAGISGGIGAFVSWFLSHIKT